MRTPSEGAATARPTQEDGSIRVVLSDRWEDVSRALEVVHEGFVEAGYMAAQPSGRRFVATYLNPGTVFALLEVGGEPAATMAHIADGPFGLPGDRAYAEELDGLRASGNTLAELGSLVVRERFRASTRDLFTYAGAALVRVLLEAWDVWAACIVEPEQARFYNSMMGTEVAGEVRPLYGAPAILLGASGAQMAAHLQEGRTALTRRMAGLVLSEQTPWLEDRRTGEGAAGWPAEQVRALCTEQGALARPAAQMSLLAGLGLGLSEDVLAGSGGDRALVRSGTRA